MRNSYILGFCVFIVVMFLLAFFCLYKAFYVEQETLAGKDSVVVRHFVIKDTVVVKQTIYQKRQIVNPKCKQHSECKCCCGHKSQAVRDSLIGNQQ